jgi:hypothetical protein
MIKILLLSSNPYETERLQLDKEYREIENKINLSSNRKNINFIYKSAVKIEYILDFINEHNPDVLHFSAHGEKSKIVFESNDGKSVYVNEDTINDIIKGCKNLKVVLFNTCYSSSIAKKLSQEINFVIGMNGKISDNAAIAFAYRFYHSIGTFRNVEESFQDALIEIKLNSLKDFDKPKLFIKPGISPDDYYILMQENSLTIHNKSITEASKDSDTFINHIKISIPPISDNYIYRIRLINMLKKNYRKATFINAPPGFGKTSLIAGFVKNEGKNAVWYNFDEYDNDVIRFLRHIIVGLGKKINSIKTNNFMKLLINKNLKDIITQICNEIYFDVFIDILIVLDNFDYVSEQLDFIQCIELLIKYSPKNLKVIVISRKTLNYKILDENLSGSFLYINRDNIKFTINESIEFFNKNLSYQIDKDILDIIYSKTEGWIACLVLIKDLTTICSDNELTNIIRTISGSHIYLYDFFANELYKKLKKMYSDFLKTTSILRQMNYSCCNLLLENDNSSEILEYLDKNNSFIFNINNEKTWYYYHNLFRDFLKKEFEKTFDSDLFKEVSIKKLHSIVASYYEKEEIWDESLYHYDIANEHEKVLEIIHSKCSDLYKTGQLKTLNFWLSKVEAPYLPNIHMYKAKIYKDWKQTDAAERIYLNAYNIAKEEFSERNVCYEILAETVDDLRNIYFSKENYNKAIKLYRELLCYAGHSKYKNIEIARIWNNLGVLFKLNGNDINVNLFDWALNLANDVNGMTGIDISKQDINKKVLISSYNNNGLISENFRKYDNALIYFNKALLLCEKNQCGNILINIARVNIAKGNMADAVDKYFQASRIYENLSELNMVAFCLNSLLKFCRSELNEEKEFTIINKLKKINEDLLKYNNDNYIYSKYLFVDFNIRVEYGLTEKDFSIKKVTPYKIKELA